MAKTKKIWQKSSDTLIKILHPNAVKKEVSDSVYQQIYAQPDYLFKIVQEKIVEWRNRKSTLSGEKSI